MKRLVGISIGHFQKTYGDIRALEIAKEIGISQAQVSRLEKGALERIRKEF
jgi:DNA-directed RNA polymerase specialized sigma subunit